MRSNYCLVTSRITGCAAACCTNPYSKITLYCRP
jgi:hypothetical protein